MDQKSDTLHSSQQILDIAQHLVQTRGYNGFSYANIASALHVSKASLHYHFASKAILGTTLIERYTNEFSQALDAITALGSRPPDQLRSFVEIYARVLSGGRICLCGMLTAEFMTLPPAMQVALDRFFNLTEGWLAEVLERGRNDGSVKLTMPPADAAQYIVSALEGSMMMARAHGGMSRFNAAAQHLLTEFEMTY
jgi:TetR/AcrR family transcriptional regulator, transcriptional repressor for nem operon